MKPLQALYRRQFNRVMAGRSLNDLSQSAIVFAPHPDDETLGCGGTLIRKKQADAAVKIVFMTDGSRSHASLMAPSELRNIRHREALQAAQTLGVAAEDVIFLGFEDGQLAQSVAAAVERVSDLLALDPPAEVFVPYYRDPPADHQATTQVVMAALRRLSLSPTIYTYPIWYWRQWPWTALAGASKRETLNVLSASLKSGLGTAIFRDFQHSVPVGLVLAQKRMALEQHASQMQKPADNPAWPTLGDVSAGDFLDCFFLDYEIFHSPSL